MVVTVLGPEGHRDQLLFDQGLDRPQVGEGLTGRAARLESWAGTEASPGGPADAPEDAERLSYRLALGAAPGTNARWLEAVVRSDAGISFENLLICSLSLLSKRSTRNSLPQSARATKHSAVSCAAMGTFTPRRRTHVPSGFALLKCVPVRCVLFIASDQ